MAELILRMYPKKRKAQSWQAWIGRNVRRSRASLAKSAAHGCFENLEDLSIDEVMEQFDVTREQIAAVLEFVARSLQVPAPVVGTASVHAHPL